MYSKIISVVPRYLSSSDACLRCVFANTSCCPPTRCSSYSDDRRNARLGSVVRGLCGGSTASPGSSSPFASPSDCISSSLLSYLSPPNSSPYSTLTWSRPRYLTDSETPALFAPDFNRRTFTMSKIKKISHLGQIERFGIMGA
jgi:hypothetical protein